MLTSCYSRPSTLFIVHKSLLLLLFKATLAQNMPRKVTPFGPFLSTMVHQKDLGHLWWLIGVVPGIPKAKIEQNQEGIKQGSSKTKHFCGPQPYCSNRLPCCYPIVVPLPYCCFVVTVNNKNNVQGLTFSCSMLRARNRRFWKCGIVTSTLAWQGLKVPQGMCDAL